MSEITGYRRYYATIRRVIIEEQNVVFVTDVSTRQQQVEVAAGHANPTLWIEISNDVNITDLSSEIVHLKQV